MFGEVSVHEDGEFESILRDSLITSDVIGKRQRRIDPRWRLCVYLSERDRGREQAGGGRDRARRRELRLASDPARNRHA